MFDNRWDNWAGDFADSPQAASYSPGLRDRLTDILRQFGEAMLQFDPDFPDNASSSSLAAALRVVMTQPSVTAAIRDHIPQAISGFLEYLGETGRIADAEEWAATIRKGPASAKEAVKPASSAKGVTIKRSEKVSPLGRNDPCPCGSGKKFKKCCMTAG